MSGFGFVYLAFSGIDLSASLKSTTPSGAVPSNWKTWPIEGQFLRILRNFCTATLSPRKTDAPDLWTRYSMSLSTKSVVAGQMTIPDRSAAVAISHLCWRSVSTHHLKREMSHHSGNLGMMINIFSPAFTPKRSRKRMASLCD